MTFGQFERANSVARQIMPARLEANEADILAINALVWLAEMADLKGDHRAAQKEAERMLLVQPTAPFCLYLAGLYALRGGDVTAAERHLLGLETVAKLARGPLVPHYRDALLAEFALTNGRPRDAQPLLEAALSSGTLRYEYGRTPAVHFQDAMARVHLAMGQKARAADTLEELVKLGSSRLWHPALYIRGVYTLGKLRLDLDDRTRGRQRLQEFLMYWGKADWDLPEVRDARRLLAATNRI
jgi:tetratricopeptide (TPR) repeat protein